MMTLPRWRKVTSDLWGNKTRSLLVIASITIGLFAVGLIVNMFLIISQDMRAGYRLVNPANIVTSTTPFDQDLVDHVRHVQGVSAAEGLYSITLRVRSASGEWKPIDIEAFSKIDQKKINLLRLEQGIWPPADQELAIDRYKLGDLPVGVGGSVEIELPSGKTRMLKVVGVVNDQTLGATSPGGFFTSPITAYTTLETLKWLEIPVQMNQLYITVDKNLTDRESIRQVSNLVSKAVEESGRTVFGASVRASDDHPNRIYVEAISAILLVLGFLVMFLSAFLITNTLSALLNQQVHQIGVMKTVGARRPQIMGIYMLQIFFYGLIAFIIAQPLSSRLSYLLLSTVANEINISLQGYRVISEVVWLLLIIALIVPQGAGFIPILQGTQITVVDALSGYNQANPPSQDSWVYRTAHRFRNIPRPLALSLRNTFRRRGRLILTLFTLTLGGAVFISTFNSQRSLTAYIDHIGRYFLADVNTTFKRYYRADEIIQAIKEVPGVRGVEAWSSSQAELIMPDGTTGEKMSLLGPPLDSKLIDPAMLEGRWLQPGDSNAITVNERFREIFPNLKVGDTLRIKISGAETDVVVVGFFQLIGKSGGFTAYTSYDFLSNKIHQANRANTFRITADRKGLNLEEQKELGRVIEAHMKDRGYLVGETEGGHSLTADAANGLNILTGFLLTMALLTAVVGSIGLAGTMSMNVLERTREIGIIRAIGASDRAVINMVMVEGVLIGLMSWVLGTLLSFPISSLMSNAMNLALFGATAEFTFTPTGVILWLVIVLVLSVLASVVPARNAANLTIREVLAYE
jgi:putative ABC transport system permease protein